MSIESMMLSNNLILCCPLLLLPSIFPSIRVFSNDLVLCIRELKYWDLGFSISHSNEQSGLISFRVGLFDLLAVQGTLKSLLRHSSSKASILQCSAAFMVPFMVTLTSVHDHWKNHSFDYMDLCQQSGPLSLLFNMLFRFVIAFLPRGKHLLISWQQSLSSDFGAQENKVCHCFHFSPSICYEVMGPDAMILVFSVLSFKPVFSLFSFTSIQRLFSSSLFSAIWSDLHI